MRHIIITFILSALVTFPATQSLAAPNQFMLLDVTDQWVKTKIYRESDHRLGEGQPERWGDPVDFQFGQIHMRLEIFSKPSDLEIISMICLWQNGNESCTRRQDPDLIRFTKPGVYYGSFPSPGDGDDKQGSKKWGRPSAPHAGKHYFRGTDNADRVLLQWWVHREDDSWKILREGSATNPEPSDFGKAVEAHIPIDYRLEIYVSAKDTEFVPPDHWLNK